MTSIGSSTHRRSHIRDSYRADILNEAEAICRGELATTPNDASLLHLRGLLALQKGQDDFALACFARAVTLDGNNMAYRLDLADILERTGLYGEAFDNYQCALIRAPSDLDVHCRLALCAFRLGRLKEAVALYEEALRIDPTRARTHGDIADVQEAQGCRVEALAHYERAVQLDPEDISLCRRLGRAYMRSGDWKMSADIFRQGLRRQRDHADLLIDVGEVFIRSGHFQEAMGVLRAALAIEPYNASGCRYLVFALEMLGRRDDAVDAWCRLATALEHNDCPREAAAAYREALVRNPSNLRALVGLGSVQLLQLAEPHSAIEHLKTALTLEPEHAAAHQRLGWSYALVGHLEHNWEEIAWIDRHGPWKRFEQPAWSGSSLTGRTILLWINAGLGDMIQHLRFVPQVKACGCRVILECHKRLVPLIERMECVDQVVAINTPLPAFDVQALMAALPRIFGVSWLNIPADVPYLTGDASLRAEWARRLGIFRGTTVGLVWGSRPTTGRRQAANFKSIPLAAFSVFAGLPRIRYISLQLGAQAEELIAPPPRMSIESPLEESTTILDTVAAIQNLDLVITVDTMVAHLAGALAIPVWTLIPYASDWRWGLHTDASPWYPSMRLFRQTRPGDWLEVLRRVRGALEASV
jgi:tetratricopeptide (TPR) repeat protein